MGGGSATLAAHLQQLRQSKGESDDNDQNNALFPIALQYLWGYFVELNLGRSSNGFGPNPLSYTEILSWAWLTRTPIAVWEIEVLKELDIKWINTYGGSSETKPSNRKQRR